MKLLEAENREEFDQLLLQGDPTHPHMAMMADRAAKFIANLADEAQRDALLEEALDFAWRNRHTFNAQYESLGMFWTRCLRAAALTREKWLVNWATMPGVFEKRWILGRRLGDY